MREFFHWIRWLLLKSLVKFSVDLVKIIKPKITLTYDSESPKDGSGAQVQRILGIYSLAKKCQLGYLHTQIDDVSTHPYDYFQKENLRKAYVKRLNKTFKLKDFPFPSNSSIQIPSLTFFNILKLSIGSRLFNKKLLVRIKEPYRVIDYLKNPYSELPRNILIKKDIEIKYRNSIIMHYRYGVGNFAKYHNESITRQVDLEYYKNSIRFLLGLNDQCKKLLILTDAPSEFKVFTPPKNQIKNWENTPRFNGKSVSLIPYSIKDELSEFGLKVEVRIGGDPIKAFQIMANAGALIVGRSSFSYLGGLLNKHGLVVYPKAFWHPPLRNWKVIEDIFI